MPGPTLTQTADSPLQAPPQPTATTPPSDPAEQILRSVQGVDSNAQADAWDAFHQSKNEDELSQRLQNINIPQDVKANLWDAKRSFASSKQGPSAASQPGAFQTRKGGPIQNVNNPSAVSDREADVIGTQAALEAAGSTAPGGQAMIGAVKGAFKTGLGLASLAAHGAHALGIRTDETDALARGDISPFSEAMSTPTNPEQHLGNMGEEVAEWIGGEEAFKGIALGEKLTKIKKVADFVQEFPRIAKLLSIGANVTKSAAIGATQGGVKGAAEGNAVGGAESGAIGGTIGGVAGEVAPVVTQKLGEVLEKHAPDFVNGLLRANKKANYLYGKNPGQAVVDEGVNVPKSLTLAGQLENLHGQLESAGENLDSQIKQTLSDPKIAAKRQDIVPTIQDTIEAAKQHVTGQTGIDTKAYLNELDKLEDNIFTKYDTDGNVIGNVKGARLSPAEISDVKKSIGKGTQWNLDPRDPEFQVKAYANSVRKQIYGQLADMVEQAAPEVGKLNSRFSNVIEAQGLLEKRIAQEHGTGGYNAALRKGEWGTALGLIFSGHAYLGLPLIANRIARSVPGRVLESQGAAAAGKAMQSPVVGELAQGAKPAIANAIRVQFTDGSTHEVHPEDVDEALKRNPGAKVISEENQ